MLEATGRFDVRVVEDVAALESRAVTDRYRTIILNGQADRSMPGLRRNLTRYVHRGGGLVAIHWAIDNFHDWPGFSNLLGRSWQEGVSAEEHGAFEIAPTLLQNPITTNLVPWTTPAGEAVHYRLKGRAPISILATTHTALGGDQIPVAFIHMAGRGRAFFTPLGHSFATRADPNFQILIARAVEWSATGTVR